MTTSPGLCLEPACFDAAAHIFGNLAPDYWKYDPCTQFEEMVCYGFREKRPRETEELSLTGMYNRRIEKAILASDYEYAVNHTTFVQRSDDATSTDRANFAKLKRAYNACMNETLIAEAGIAPLVSFIQDITTLFPVNDSTSLLCESDHEGLQAAILNLETFGISAFMSLKVDTDTTNSSKSAFYIDPPIPAFPNTAAYMDSSDLESYRTALELVLQEISAATQRALSNDEMAASALGVVQLDEKLSNASHQFTTVAYPNRHLVGTITSLDEVAELAPSLNYRAVLSALVPEGVSPANVTVCSNMLLQSVEEIIRQTPKLILQTWLIWRIVINLKDYVQSPSLEPIATSSHPDRATICLKHVDTTLRFIMGRFYVGSVFTADKRDAVSVLLINIRKQFTERIQSLSWMSDPVKALAIEKVNNIQHNIVYPSTPGSKIELFSPDQIAELYENQYITDSYFTNQLTYQKWEVAFQMSKLSKPVDRGEFDCALDSIDAFYAPLGNNIFVLAGILQGIVFDQAMPSYANYGALGAILGHELTHGFDDRGRFYNKDGSYLPWWDNGTIANFQMLSQCFIDQYSNFTYLGSKGPVQVDGQRTLSENLADAGGLQAAHDTWMSNRPANELRLPGLEMFTPEQLFYVFYANMWCSSYSPAVVEARFAADEHAAPNVRIRGMTENSRSFRTAFDCPVKEPVCEIW